MNEKRKSASWLEKVVTPGWMRLALPLVTWRKEATAEKKIYLTFDDGPTTELTEWILSELKRHNAKATFFCIGENITRHPEQVAAMMAAGHLICNHSHRHLNGWKTNSKEYVDDVLNCQKVLTQSLGCSPRYFRPPFGRISIRQWCRLRREFEIVLWDILSMDYRPELTGSQVANNVIQNAKAGSIVVMHDSILAAERVTRSLPLIVDHFSNAGFQMCRLDE